MTLVSGARTHRRRPGGLATFMREHAENLIEAAERLEKP